MTKLEQVARAIFAQWRKQMGNATGDNTIAEAQHGFNLREALKDDLKFICMEADGIALLPGWENSKGAIAERATALALGLHVMTIDEAALTSR